MKTKGRRSVSSAGQAGGGSQPAGHPITRAEWRIFRSHVFDALRRRGGVFPGAVRAFASVLMQAHGPQRPFEIGGGQRGRCEPSALIERRIRVLEHEGALRFSWGRSDAYRVVSEIRLVEAAAKVEPPQPFISRTEPTSAGERAQRQMEVLARLCDIGGRAENAPMLLPELVRVYGDRHRQTTLFGDIRGLMQRRCIHREAGRVRGRPTLTLLATGRGRKVLAQYRAEHDGHPRPPIAIGVRADDEGTPAGTAPARKRPQRAVKSSVLNPGPRSLEVLRAIWERATPERPGVTPREISNRLNEKLQRVRVRLCDLVDRGFVSRLPLAKGRMAYALTEQGKTAIGVTPTSAAPTPPAVPAPEPPPATVVSVPPAQPSPAGQPSPATTAPTREDIVRLVAKTEEEITRIQTEAQEGIARATQVITERAREKIEPLNNRLRQLRELLASMDAIAEQVAKLLTPSTPHAPTT